MASIYETAANVSNPLGLAGLFAAIFFGIARLLIVKKIFPQLREGHAAPIIRLIIERLFILSLVAMLLGFAGYVITHIAPPPSSSGSGQAQPSLPPSPTYVTDQSVLGRFINQDATNSYTGSVKDGFPEGQGTLYVKAINNDGPMLTYVGEFVHGTFSGKGRLTNQAPDDNITGDYLEGQFAQGRFVEGIGRISYDRFVIPETGGTVTGLSWEGGVYEGDLKAKTSLNNLEEIHNTLYQLVEPDGNGTYKYIAKNAEDVSITFDGHWNRSKFEGQGSVVVADSSNLNRTIEKGEFTNCKLINGTIDHGVSGRSFGVDLMPPTYMIYSGQVVDSQLDGEVDIMSASNSDRTYFKGTYKNGGYWDGLGWKQDGSDAEDGTWKDGKFFEGEVTSVSDSNDHRVFKHVYKDGAVVSNEELPKN